MTGGDDFFLQGKCFDFKVKAVTGEEEILTMQFSL